MYVYSYEKLVAICSQLYTYICKPVSSSERLLFLVNNRQLVDLDSEKEVSTRKRTGVKKKKKKNFCELTQKLQYTLQNLIDLKRFLQIKLYENRGSDENYLP